VKSRLSRALRRLRADIASGELRRASQEVT
jgi:hypothetical protein